MNRKKHRRARYELEARNSHTIDIWGVRGVRHIVGTTIFPIPLTRYTFWVRRGYLRIFHISHFDLVD